MSASQLPMLNQLPLPNRRLNNGPVFYEYFLAEKFQKDKDNDLMHECMEGFQSS
jgi:hypothetical protein